MKLHNNNKLAEQLIQIKNNREEIQMGHWTTPRIRHFLHLFALHYICITFAFRTAPGIDIFALHFINI